MKQFKSIMIDIISPLQPFCNLEEFEDGVYVQLLPTKSFRL